MKKQRVSKEFLKELKNISTDSSNLDNAKDFEKVRGYKRDEAHFSKLKESYKKYSYLTA